jgi:FkbM family methyltransferase
MLANILRSILDRTFLIKLHNRLSATRYVPAPEVEIDDHLLRHYRGQGWRNLSLSARRAWVDFFPLFSAIKIHSVVHVGAHDGTFALSLKEAFPDLMFHLIEPVPSTFQKLLANVASQPNMKCLNLAAGEKEEILEMFVDDFSPASSLLPYESRAIQEFPFLGKGHAIKVQIMPLDQILQSCGAEKVDMLIMDVQGYEDKVLQGAQRTLKSCDVIMSELSLQDLYRGSSTFDSVYQALVREGFRLKHLLNPIRGTHHTILQIDGVFVRNHTARNE